MVVRDAKRAAILFFARGGGSDISDISDRSDRALSGDCGPGNEKEKTSVSKSSLGG